MLHTPAVEERALATTIIEQRYIHFFRGDSLPCQYINAPGQVQDLAPQVRPSSECSLFYDFMIALLEPAKCKYCKADGINRRHSAGFGLTQSHGYLLFGKSLSLHERVLLASCGDRLPDP